MRVKHSDGGEWAAFLVGAHFYWVVTGGYLNRIGTVKYSHNGPVKGSRPGNPGKDAFTKKKAILHKSFFFFVPHIISLSFFHRVVPMSEWRRPSLLSVSLLHCGGVSPTISMPCCWSCARSKAFSFFSSSILRTKKKKISLSTFSSPWQLNIAPSLQSKLFLLKAESAGCVC